MTSVLVVLGAYIVIVLILAVAVYVLYGISHMKALKALGYDKAWLAWIPFGNYYAMADSVTGDNEESVTLFGSVNIPVMVYKLWWIGLFIAPFIPVVGNILSMALMIVFAGNAYMKMYAELENKSEQETQVVGYISGFISIIPIVKFLAGKYN